MLPKLQRHPLRRVLQWTIKEAQVTYWWVKTHREVCHLVTNGGTRILGNILSDAQVTAAVKRGTRGDWVAVPLPLQPTCSACPTAGGAAEHEWSKHAPKKWRPPWLYTRVEQLLKEYPEVGITLVPLHLGMRHPIIMACPRCEH